MVEFAPHLRISAIGVIGPLAAPVEQFTFTLSMAGDDNVTFPNDLNAVALGMLADFQGFFSAASTRISPNAWLTSCKVAVIGSDGKYVRDPGFSTFSPGGVPGGSTETSANAVPPQSALAVSLVTATRGPSGRGRFFIPMPVLLLEAGTMTAPAASVESIAANAATLINNLNNFGGLDATQAKVCVASTKGFNSAVTGVRVGRAVDTIRSRRQALVEAYSSTVDVD